MKTWFPQLFFALPQPKLSAHVKISFPLMFFQEAIVILSFIYFFWWNTPTQPTYLHLVIFFVPLDILAGFHWASSTVYNLQLSSDFIYFVVINFWRLTFLMLAQKLLMITLWLNSTLKGFFYWGVLWLTMTWQLLLIRGFMQKHFWPYIPNNVPLSWR